MCTGVHQKTPENYDLEFLSLKILIFSEAVKIGMLYRKGKKSTLTFCHSYLYQSGLKRATI